MKDISRKETERLLLAPGNKPGAFLVRESETSPGEEHQLPPLPSSSWTRLPESGIWSQQLVSLLTQLTAAFLPYVGVEYTPAPPTCEPFGHARVSGRVTANLLTLLVANITIFVVIFQPF